MTAGPSDDGVADPQPSTATEGIGTSDSNAGDRDRQPGLAAINAAILRSRVRNHRLHRKTRRAVRSYRNHLQALGTRAYPTKGQFAERLALTPGVQPNGRQNLLFIGANHLDICMTHVDQAYEGAARLLSYAAGPPLPWSAMVLARTAFEGSLRILDILAPLITPELQLARMAAQTLEAVSVSEKMNFELPPGKLTNKITETLSNRRSDIESWCSEVGLICSKTRSGKVTTNAGETAAFPFNMVAASKSLWDPFGRHTFRWLCTYTHAGPQVAQKRTAPVAEADVKNTFAAFAVVTEAVWMAMDAYSRRWVGIPNNRVMRLMRGVKNYCGSVFEKGIPKRPAEAGEDALLAAIGSALERGLVDERLHGKFVRSFTRRT